ncbi:MAG: Gfo/Idh/MocA family oxidoreductase [Anaerolineaceae bacterium]|nr:Gfo/Idh/MocA family oxidoreductase [Anaerolineaceae bacterium]
MTREIGVGVIGMGWMGEVHSRAYREIRDRFYNSGIKPRMIACSDNVLERATAAQERFGFEHHTTDWREVMANPDIEAVNITTPNGLHLEMVRAAAAAGKHILCEKPVGKDPQETALCEHAARQAGVLTFVGYNYRWPPMVQYAKQLIEDGRLGRLTHYRSRFVACYASDPYGVLSWRFLRENGLGILSDLGSHALDMAHFIAGPIEKVIGNKETFIRERPLPKGGGTHFNVGGPDDPMGEVTNEDYVGALLRFANGVQGTMEMCRVINGPKAEYTFEIHGTAGAIKWNFEQMNELEVQFRSKNEAEDGYRTILAGPAHPYYDRFNPGPGMVMGYEDLKVIESFNFLNSIAAGKPGSPGFGEALQVANVQTAIERSWESERWETVESIQVE